MATTTRRLARTVSRLETLFQLALDDPDGRALRAQALEFAVELTDSHGGYLHFFDDETQTIDLEVWSREVHDYCEVEQAQHYPLESAGIWADCVRLRRPVMHNDYPNMPEEAKRGLPDGHFALYRHLAVPVIEHGKVVAIGGVGNKEEPYDHDDVEALQLFMNSMWSVLQQGTAHAAQREAMTHRQRFERLLDTVPVGVAEIDVTHVLPLLEDLPVPVERTASWLREHPTKTLRILGAATLRASNGPMRDFLRIARLDSLDPVLGGLPNGLANLRPGATPRWPVRDVRLGPDGEILHTDLDGAFRTDPRGAILSITAVDRTADMRRQESLEAALGARDELIASVSHELRTPLTVVQGLLEAADGVPQAEVGPLIEDALSHANELGLLIDDLLLLARMRAGDVALEIQAVEVPSAVRKVVRDGLRTGSITDAAVNGELVVAADRRRLIQVIRNLLTNATRYGGPNVLVELGERDGFGQICVTDDGPGLTDLSEEEAFRAFGTTRTVSLTQSIGVGLPVSRLLMEAMGGTLTYRRADGWTHFLATLPLA